MYSKKDLILNNLDMKDILNFYGIKISKNQFCCPFHNDKSPSAKCYEKTFYCFACNEGGDLIQFVQNFFNIDFVTAMEKINKDFNLGITYNKTLDKKKIEEFNYKRLLQKAKREEKIRQKRSKMIQLCNDRKVLMNIYKHLKEDIDPYNWEENEEICGFILEIIEQLDVEFDELNTKK